MSLINDVLDSLEDLQFPEISELELVAACDQGPSSTTFTNIVSQLTTQLQQFYGVQECVNKTNDPSGAESFLFEISGFLKEFGCPYPTMISGNLTQRLSNKQDCLCLLLFLTSEVQAARINACNRPQTTTTVPSKTDNPVYQCLRSICIALKMSKPPDNIGLQNFFTGIAKKLNEAVARCPKHLLSKPVIKTKFGPVHWEKLDQINGFLRNEYVTRMDMLLKRLDVTILSFNWSEKAKSNMDGIASAYRSKRQALTADTHVEISDLLAAREDITQFQKTSSGNTRFQCNINKIKMGNVPDRGGRTSEIRAPAPEMPSWQKRQDPPQGQRQGRGDYNNRGRGGGRGGQNNRPHSGQNDRQFSGQGGYQNDRPQSGGRGYNNRGGGGSRPQSGRGGGKWGRGRGGYNQGGAFEQAFQGHQSGRTYYHS